MADTYTQIYIHIVFAVKGRQRLIPKEHKETLHQYITRIITNKKQTMLRINSMPDHIHIFIGLTPDIAISDLVRDIKANSTKFINNNEWVLGGFEWQTGYSAFSYGRSQIDDVIEYIKNQEKHHKRITFQEEYLEFLQRFDVSYNPKYVFDPDDESET
ncbi:IS200/IS605 family transposase [Candidatus Poribacteria bacterium]|nr:IS200/IS605 family transposase [Candidatus Poribacteria bacterium]